MPHLLMPSAAWRPTLELSNVVRMAAGPHNDDCVLAEDKVLEVQGQTRLTITPASVIPSSTLEASSRSTSCLLHPCTSTFSGTPWYTMDKPMPQDH